MGKNIEVMVYDLRCLEQRVELLTIMNVIFIHSPIGALGRICGRQRSTLSHLSVVIYLTLGIVR